MGRSMPKLNYFSRKKMYQNINATTLDDLLNKEEKTDYLPGL